MSGLDRNVISPDGNWVWDGTAWREAISADGKFRFDGTRWVPHDGERSARPMAPPLMAQELEKTRERAERSLARTLEVQEELDRKGRELRTRASAEVAASMAGEVAGMLQAALKARAELEAEANRARTAINSLNDRLQSAEAALEEKMRERLDAGRSEASEISKDVVRRLGQAVTDAHAAVDEVAHDRDTIVHAITTRLAAETERHETALAALDERATAFEATIGRRLEARLAADQERADKIANAVSTDVERAIATSRQAIEELGHQAEAERAQLKSAIEQEAERATAQLHALDTMVKDAEATLGTRLRERVSEEEARSAEVARALAADVDAKRAEARAALEQLATDSERQRMQLSSSVDQGVDRALMALRTLNDGVAAMEAEADERLRAKLAIGETRSNELVNETASHLERTRAAVRTEIETLSARGEEERQRLAALLELEAERARSALSAVAERAAEADAAIADRVHRQLEAAEAMKSGLVERIEKDLSTARAIGREAMNELEARSAEERARLQALNAEVAEQLKAREAALQQQLTVVSELKDALDTRRKVAENTATHLDRATDLATEMSAEITQQEQRWAGERAFWNTLSSGLQDLETRASSRLAQIELHQGNLAADIEKVDNRQSRFHTEVEAARAEIEEARLRIGQDSVKAERRLEDLNNMATQVAESHRDHEKLKEELHAFAEQAQATAERIELNEHELRAMLTETAGLRDDVMNAHAAAVEEIRSRSEQAQASADHTISELTALRDVISILGRETESSLRSQRSEWEENAAQRDAALREAAERWDSAAAVREAALSQAGERFEKELNSATQAMDAGSAEVRSIREGVTSMASHLQQVAAETSALAAKTAEEASLQRTALIERLTRGQAEMRALAEEARVTLHGEVEARTNALRERMDAMADSVENAQATTLADLAARRAEHVAQTEAHMIRIAERAKAIETSTADTVATALDGLQHLQREAEISIRAEIENATSSVSSEAEAQRESLKKESERARTEAKSTSEEAAALIAKLQGAQQGAELALSTHSATAQYRIKTAADAQRDRLESIAEDHTDKLEELGRRLRSDSASAADSASTALNEISASQQRAKATVLTQLASAKDELTALTAAKHEELAEALKSLREDVAKEQALVRELNAQVEDRLRNLPTRQTVRRRLLLTGAVAIGIMLVDFVIIALLR